MKTAGFLLFATLAAMSLRADFSYTTTVKMPGSDSGQTTRVSFKGSRIVHDSPRSTVIVDFDAQTVTHLDKTAHTYSVTPFGEMGEDLHAKDVSLDIDVKQSGQSKTVDGYRCEESIMTMQVEAPQARQIGGKITMEAEIWTSSEVPGAAEMQRFYAKYGDRFPWASLSGAGNSGMQAGMAKLQRKMAGLHGVPVLVIVQAKMPGAPSGPTPQQTEKAQQGMEQARAKLEVMVQGGGPQAAFAQQALSRMNAMFAGGGGGFRTTVESSGFSTGVVPDSAFSVPPGFQKTATK